MEHQQVIFLLVSIRRHLGRSQRVVGPTRGRIPWIRDVAPWGERSPESAASREITQFTLDRAKQSLLYFSILCSKLSRSSYKNTFVLIFPHFHASTPQLLNTSVQTERRRPRVKSGQLLHKVEKKVTPLFSGQQPWSHFWPWCDSFWPRPLQRDHVLPNLPSSNLLKLQIIQTTCIQPHEAETTVIGEQREIRQLAVLPLSRFPRRPSVVRAGVCPSVTSWERKMQKKWARGRDCELMFPVNPASAAYIRLTQFGEKQFFYFRT